MITEDYVSFETAKLLKEKGFDENTLVNYFIGDDKPRGCVVGEMIYHKRAEEDTHLIACPTLQMAMKWLREVHNLHIGVIVAYHHIPRRYEAHIMKLENVDDFILYQQVDFASYEEACEAAIKYCLENLI